ncbi:XdhC family protein [Shinella sp.]|uniref:XdhC family protein n=1 Tax=Shinella sp. TaxID=1870904 RepID=UPI003F6E84A4
MKMPAGSWDQFDDYVVDFAIDRRRRGERIAIVTLVQIEGSSPRPLGAQMAVSESGHWTGYLSGGCIERAVVTEAIAAIQEGESRRVRYGRGSKYFDIQLPCGSAIELVFDVSIADDDLVAIDARLHRRLPAIMHVPSLTDDDGETLTRIYAPRTRLIIAGIGPSAVQLARLSLLTGFEVVLYSPDRETREEVLKTSGVEVVPIPGPASLPTIHADRHTAIAVMFHDHEWETNLLPPILETDAFYVGAMRSRKTHQRRLDILGRFGVAPEKLGRIRGPAGLFESGKSASSIALSILAEIMQANVDASVGTGLLADGGQSQSLPAWEPPGQSLPAGCLSRNGAGVV